MIELRLAPTVVPFYAAAAGNFTAWVPIDMAPTLDGAFVLRVCDPPEAEIRWRVVVDFERWTVDDIAAIDVTDGRSDLYHTAVDDRVQFSPGTAFRGLLTALSTLKTVTGDHGVPCSLVSALTRDAHL